MLDLINFCFYSPQDITGKALKLVKKIFTNYEFEKINMFISVFRNFVYINNKNI